MFSVHHSNSLDILKDELISLIKQHPLKHPFDKEIMLVQSPGMAQWLQMEIAKVQGVAANIEFPLPATFIWDMFIRVLSHVPKRSFFNKEAMMWKLMKILPMQLEDPDFAELKQYLQDDPLQVKLFQLAGKIADIYDQYLLYRPDWINAWETKKPIDELANASIWQSKLWRELYDQTLTQDQSPYHRANLHERFIETLQSHQQKPIGLNKIQRVFVFGISALPPTDLEVLKALGEHLEVHYMFTNPCRYYWGDLRDKRYLSRSHAKHQARLSRDSTYYKEESDVLLNACDESLKSIGNSLLASMGKLGRDNLLLISDLNCQEFAHRFLDIDRYSLLSHLQADILDLIEPGDVKQTETSTEKKPIAIDDRSIMIERCHSPMREVEVLHDRLLDMFADDPKLTPRDVIVMVGDINAYSPAIQAVFGNAPGERFIPFSISDRTADQESPIISTFLRLLSLSDSRCTASELLEIFEIPAVLRRFEIDQYQFDKLKLWIEESGIRWGLDQNTATQFDLPQQHQNTWRFGIERLLLGYAMPSDAGIFNGISAYDEVQGLEADIAGKLAHFCQVIESIQIQSSQAKTGNEWASFLVKLLDDVFTLEEEEERVGRLIRAQLQAWLEQLEDAAFIEPIGLSIVHEHFKNKLGGEQVSQRFLAGQVNFCTLMPMRSIPFSVVCLLGMNDGVYPRSVAPLGFDLMASRARPGDRSRRDDDRYLFLEAIHSAQSRLYISFMHRSIKDNSEKVPSVLVSELLNYCTQGYCLMGDEGLPAAKSADNLLKHLCHENPMVPFSPNAFLSRYPSYAAEWLPAAKGEGQSALPFIDEHGLPSDPDFKVSVLELDDLQRFWRAPVKFFFNHRLKVFFDNQETVIDENEPFELDHLQRYLIRDDLLKHLLQHGDSEASKEKFFRIKQASGQLPHGDFGAQAMEKEYGDIHSQYEKVLPYLVDKRQALEVNLTLSTSKGPVQLQGWLSERYREGQFFYRPGNVSGKYLLAATINHLCQNAMGESLPTHYLGIQEEILFEPVERAKAIERLTDFVEQYLAGIDQPYQYFPNTVYAGYQASLNKDGEWVDDERGTEKALKAMREAFYGGYLKTGEMKDPYIGRVWQRLEEEEFLALRALGKKYFYTR